MPQVSEFSWVFIFFLMVFMLFMLMSQMKSLFNSSPRNSLKFYSFVFLI